MHTILENAKRLYRLKRNQKLPQFRRFLYDSLRSQQSKVVGIYGSRGVGKTTLLLQLLESLDLPVEQKLYISCDHPIYQEISLFDLVDEFSKKGGEAIVIDEIHQADDFQKQIKLIYDYLDIRVYFSGSSAVRITNPDFTRRYAMYHLPILSLREFIELSLDVKLKTLTLDDILQRHESNAWKIIDELPDKKILKHFEHFLKIGAYPFYFEDATRYLDRITETINTILYTDLTHVTAIQADKLDALKKLMATLCVSEPMELSIDRLARTVGISKPTLYKYLEYLNRAELITLVTHEAKRFKSLRKPDKLYLGNPNLFHALCMDAKRGTLRESFFVSMLQRHPIHYATRGDFLIDEKITVEVGGKNKGFDQIKDRDNAYIAADGIEVGAGRKIPLWLFGFLY